MQIQALLPLALVGLALMPGPVPQSAGSPTRLQPASDNLLGNGGFESWLNGTSPLGPVGPDQWHAMGTTAGTFTQGDIRFTRAVEDCCADAAGPWVMEISATVPGNFVSQRLENWRELRGETVTFSIDVRTSFGAALPAIEINDGVTSRSSSAAIGDGPGLLCEDPWTRLTVRKAIDPCATQVELRIYPDQTVQVNDAMAALGNYGTATYVPRTNPEPALAEVPLGTVLDWYRFDISIPVPEGFAICDGSAIADAGSPFLGTPTPNLLNRFVRGVTSLGSIGTTGGSSTTSTPNSGGFWNIPQFPPPPFLQAGSDTHTHTVPPPPYMGLLKIIRIR